ncbi:hypothetical protein NSB25_27375 [Acetatifactor muris]|uniref:Uncharacterized protein n=1 Tax=Acetatifactor muris TaxID=879566 RepID=A0A2K4ZPT4_9FIRM|nr:hypothetical protein [Acetatifactor muris]MCR2050947.1 hypothetical protein [Acetatifactor muris]SOY32469.1 hypothetical protein AMURIS_05234 [Acetatifactor muris]
MENIIDMFGIPILEHDGFEDPFDDGTQYRVKRWFLNDLNKYTDKWVVIGFDGTLKIFEENGDELFNGSLLDSSDFVKKLKGKIG